MTSSTLVAVGGTLCGVALLYLVISRTLKKRSNDTESQ